MTETNQPENVNEPKKKISLQDAIKQQLANKKNQSTMGHSGTTNTQSTKKMQSQQTKKVSNSRRKMGV